MLLYYGWFYVLTCERTKKTDLCIYIMDGSMYSLVKEPRKPINVFFFKKWKNENFSSTSTEREKLIDLSNKFQDKLLKGITDLSVTQYHSNEYYKPYTFQAQSELENRKRKERRTENNEAESTVLKEQDWCSKR